MRQKWRATSPWQGKCNFVGFMCDLASRISINLQSSQIYKPEETVTVAREIALRRRRAESRRRRELMGNNHDDSLTGTEGRIAIVYKANDVSRLHANIQAGVALERHFKLQLVLLWRTLEIGRKLARLIKLWALAVDSRFTETVHFL